MRIDSEITFMVDDLKLIEHKTTESNHFLSNTELHFRTIFSTAVNLSFTRKHFGRVFDLLYINAEPWELIQK